MSPADHDVPAASHWTLPTVVAILVVGAALTSGLLTACLRPDEHDIIPAPERWRSGRRIVVDGPSFAETFQWLAGRQEARCRIYFDRPGTQLSQVLRLFVATVGGLSAGSTLWPSSRSAAGRWWRRTSAT